MTERSTRSLASRRQDRAAEHHHARAEFRRPSRDGAWVLAGVWIDHVVFQPVHPGVEPVTRRLPDTGLLGWFDLPSVIAPDARAAGEAALQVARQAFPRAVRRVVPFAASSDTAVTPTVIPILGRGTLG